MEKSFDVPAMLEMSFENLEQEIFNYVCLIGREITVFLLEQLDEHLMNNRDKKRYQAKQIRKTTIKTVYGEVEYKRRMYYDKVNEEYIYLLDDKMQMERIGTISTNLSKRIAEASINMPFRKAADSISSTTGQSISSHGIWNVVQQIGSVIQSEEDELVKELKTEHTRGSIESKVLFQEADGVYINIQENKKKAKSQEIKLSTVYTGWKDDGKTLNQKRVYAGMETAKIFNQKTEALIQSVYDTDETQIRVVNGDGASWIKNTYEPDRIFQLDRFHIKKEIRRCIPEKNIQHLVIREFENKDMDAMLDIIQTYINSIDDGKNASKLKMAKNLYSYLYNNYEGLMPWQEQIETVPEPPEGVVYKNMGVQENQNCSLVCMRMKGRKMRWSVSGANNLVKLIYMQENGDLNNIIEKKDSRIEIPIDLEYKDVLSSNKVKSKVGKGNKWMDIVNVTMPMLNAQIGAYSKLLRNIRNI